MTGFQIAIERRRWEVVSLYLLLGVSDAAAKLPPESLAALAERLGGGVQPQRRRRRGG